MPAKGKSSSSHALREICSVTFDVVHASRKGNAALRLAEPYSRSVSSEAVADPADQQREPKRSPIDRETQTSFAGAEDVCTEGGQSRIDEAENTVADKEDETETDILESTQDIPGGCEADVAEEKEEPQTTKEGEPQPDDPSDRQGSVTSSSQTATAATGGETLNQEDVGELDDRDPDDDDNDNDVRIRKEKPEEAEEQVELKDEVDDTTTKEETEEDNPEQSCSAEPDVDSSSILSKHSQRSISKKTDERVRKQESRSLRHLKVLQASIATQLKWCSAVIVLQ